MNTHSLENPNLDDVLAGLGFRADTPYVYGVMFGLNCRPWEPPVDIQIRGVDWRAQFRCFGAQYPMLVPGTDASRVEMMAVEAPTVEVAYPTNSTVPRVAVSVGQPAVEAISGLIAMQLAGPFLGERLWEGLVQADPDKPPVVKMLATRHAIEVADVTRERLEAKLTGIGAVSASGLPGPLALSLRWIGRANAYMNRVDAFLAYYLATLPLIRTWHAQVHGGNPSERARFRAYVRERLKLANAEEEDLFHRFSGAHGIRNDLLKGSNMNAVTDGVLDDIRLVAWSLAAFEVKELTRP